MKWKSELTFRTVSAVGIRYNVLSKLLWSGTISFGLAVCVSYLSDDSIVLPVTGIYFLLIWFIRVWTWYIVPRRVKKMTGTSMMEYEVVTNNGELHVTAGKDKSIFPLSEFKLHEEGRGYIALKRKDVRLGVVVLYFDEPKIEQEVSKHLHKIMTVSEKSWSVL